MTAAPAPAVPDFNARTPRLTGLAAAAVLIGGDLICTLAYAALYAVTHDLRVSMAVGVLVGVGTIAWRRLRGRPVDAMQWMSLAMVGVFGALSLGFHDPRFVMVKPTLAYLAVAAVMLKPGWMARYMPPRVKAHGADWVRRFEYAWAVAMALTAATNLALALHGDLVLWGAFLATAPLASKTALFALQYGVLRLVVSRRIRALGSGSFMPA